MALHFIGCHHPNVAPDPRYDAAVAFYGAPDFVHERWDMRAKQEIAPGDEIVVFGYSCFPLPEPSLHSFNDSERQ